MIGLRFCVTFGLKLEPAKILQSVPLFHPVLPVENILHLITRDCRHSVKLNKAVSLFSLDLFSFLSLFPVPDFPDGL